MLTQCKMLVHSLVVSTLDYSNGILFGLPKKSINRLQAIQNRAAKLILLKSKHDSSTEALKALHWLPIAKRIEFKILCQVYKCLNSSAPSYLTNLLEYRVSTYGTRSISNNDLKVPKVSRLGDRAFGFAGPWLWNKLPRSIRASSSFEQFKKQLKTHLFRDL